MATFFNDIQAAFDNRLNTLTGGYDIAWSNIAYEPDAGTTYLRPSFLPTDTVQVGLGSSGLDDTRGVYQIDVVYPAGNGRGVSTKSMWFTRRVMEELLSPTQWQTTSKEVLL